MTLAGSVRIQKLNKTYVDRAGNTRTVLEDVSLDVDPEEFVCIVGPSGCGKTTLIKVVQGLVMGDSGTVEVNGVDVREATPDVGFVFQQDSLFPWRTVGANIAFPLEIRRWDKKAQRQRVDELIELVGLGGYRDSYPHELSGGMRQRVNLARALAPDLSVLIMDEPFAALDAITRAQMQTELLRIWSDQRKTVIFVTHQIDEAVLLADRVVRMSANPGRIEESTTIDIPRPRSDATRHEESFKTMVDQLWDSLHGDRDGGAGVRAKLPNRDRAVPDRQGR
jgi:NitT/TauT family transport system ATP-binding protein